MRLFEFDNALDSAAYYSPDQDNYDQQFLHDTRRPKITLKHLNQLKRMRAARQLENLVRRDVLNMMYGTPSEGGEAGGASPGF